MLTVIPLTTVQDELAVLELSHVSGLVVSLLIEDCPCRLFISKITESRLVQNIERLEEYGRFQDPHPRNLLGLLMNNLPCVPSDNFISIPGASFPTEPLCKRS